MWTMMQVAMMDISCAIKNVSKCQSEGEQNLSKDSAKGEQKEGNARESAPRRGKSPP